MPANICSLLAHGQTEVEVFPGPRPRNEHVSIRGSVERALEHTYPGVLGQVMGRPEGQPGSEERAHPWGSSGRPRAGRAAARTLGAAGAKGRRPSRVYVLQQVLVATRWRGAVLTPVRYRRCSEGDGVVVRPDPGDGLGY